MEMMRSVRLVQKMHILGNPRLTFPRALFESGKSDKLIKLQNNLFFWSCCPYDKRHVCHAEDDISILFDFSSWTFYGFKVWNLVRMSLWFIFIICWIRVRYLFVTLDRIHKRQVYQVWTSQYGAENIVKCFGHLTDAIEWCNYILSITL